MNSNLPPIPCFVYGDYFKGQTEGGHLISVRSLPNQALQFSVLLHSGALMTGVPAHYIGFKADFTPMPLSDSQMWDTISGEIDTLVLTTLRRMKCTVLLGMTNRRVEVGKYLFTIDFVGTNDLSAHPEHWKQMHAVQLDSGHLAVYPQYRVRFVDDAMCPNHEDPLPKYAHNETFWEVGQ